MGNGSKTDLMLVIRFTGAGRRQHAAGLAILDTPGLRHRIQRPGKSCPINGLHSPRGEDCLG
jgi:hypothetical protein